MLLLPEGQAGGAPESPNKAMLFQVDGQQAMENKIFYIISYHIFLFAIAKFPV
jgi:hypothetical protein